MIITHTYDHGPAVILGHPYVKKRTQEELRQPPITMVSRLMREDTLPMFYALTTFTFATGDLIIISRNYCDDIHHWMRAIGPTNYMAIRKVVLEFNDWPFDCKYTQRPRVRNNARLWFEIRIDRPKDTIEIESGTTDYPMGENILNAYRLTEAYRKWYEELFAVFRSSPENLNKWLGELSTWYQKHPNSRLI